VPLREGGQLSHELFVVDLCSSSAKVPLVMVKVGKWRGTSYVLAMAVVLVGVSLDAGLDGGPTGLRPS
jgi:hypothetical protein